MDLEKLQPKYLDESKKNLYYLTYKKYPVYIIDNLVYDFLFNGLSYRELEKKYFPPIAPKGYEPMHILHYLGISTDFKGFFQNKQLIDVITILENSYNTAYQDIIKRLCRIENSKKYLKNIEDIINEKDNSRKTERDAMIKVRIVQGEFRKNTLDILNYCPITKIENPNFLIASHIMPWSKCTEPYQRLDGYNGFMLTPSCDKLFDLGYISFENDGKLLISSQLTENERKIFLIEKDTKCDINNENGMRNLYLEYHRNNIFKP